MSTDSEMPARHTRINEQLQQYWHELANGRAYPLESEINTDLIKDIWPSCFLVTVKNSSFAYDYLGTSLIEAYGDDITGREVTEQLLYPHPPALLSSFKRVVLSGQPEMDDSEFTNANGTLVKYRSCILPLGARGRDGVAFLLGGMKWKAF